MRNILAYRLEQTNTPTASVEPKNAPVTNTVVTAQPLPKNTMNVIQLAAGIEGGWAKFMSEELGYERKTTFMFDFVIGELVEGEAGIRGTFYRAFDEWKSNKEYIAEMYLVLTHRCSMIYKDNEGLASVYSQLAGKIYDWVYASNADGKPKNVSQELVDYFFEVTD